MKNMKVLFTLFIFCLCSVLLSSVDAIQVSRITARKIEINQLQNTTLKWFYKVNQSERIEKIVILFTSTGRRRHYIGICKPNTENAMKCTTVVKYKDKYSLYVSTISTQEYRIILVIVNVSYEDFGFYDGHIAASPSEGLHTIDYIIIIVRGLPTKCGADLKLSYHFKNGETPMLNISICGYPHPKYKYNFNDEKLGFSEKAQEAEVKYNVQVQLPTLSPKMCGRKLTFTATNEYGVMEISFDIFVDFLLPTVTGIVVTRQEYCDTVKWDIIKSGLCEVRYEVELLDRNKTIHNKYFLKAYSNSIESCSIHKLKSKELTTSRVRGVYNDKYGNWSSEVKAVEFEEEPETTSKTPLILGAILGFLIIIVLIIAAIWCIRRRNNNPCIGTICRMRKNGNENWKPKKSKPTKKQELADISLLNMKSNQASTYEGSGYTGLSGTQPLQSIYTTLNTEVDLYENMDDYKTKTPTMLNEYEVPNRI